MELWGKQFGKIGICRFVKPGKAAYFSGNAVIALTTWPPGTDHYKSTEFKNSRTLLPLGYQKPKASVEFYTSDTPSTYSVVIEGIGRHKTLIYHKENAVIKVE
ncbi:hypothetical protein FACS1894123_10530 [Bacteroidia bacterium]|nr:hypothetical protein FACS1894123_10530 [Bacteroidia bacterium]